MKSPKTKFSKRWLMILLSISWAGMLLLVSWFLIGHKDLAIKVITTLILGSSLQMSFMREYFKKEKMRYQTSGEEI